jgi:glycosyltransferase involved in cell wall biosynthesis
MKRILLLIKGLGRGGAERLLVDAVRHGDRTRFAYEVAYLLPAKSALVPELEAMDVPVHCLDGARNVRWVGCLRGLVRRQDVDLVHVHSPYPAAVARLGLPRRVPIVYTEHNQWERYRTATYLGNALTFARNAHVFTVSEHVRRSVAYPRAIRFMPMPMVETLYHGLDPLALALVTPDGVRAEFGIPESVPLVGTVANFKEHKGYSYLLEAARTVRQAAPEARFLLVGIGPGLEEQKRRARHLGLNGFVIFAGFRSDALRLMAALDVFVLPSLQEGLSIALIEAMALGRPTVVTNVGGLPEVVENGSESLVVPAADSSALARAIVALLEDGDLRRRLGHRARRRAAEFDIRKAVRRMEEVYDDLLFSAPVPA